MFAPLSRIYSQMFIAGALHLQAFVGLKHPYLEPNKGPQRKFTRTFSSGT